MIFSSGISESVGVLVVDRSKLTKGATYLIPLQLEQSEDLETITSDTKKTLCNLEVYVRYGG